ncbi:metallophosphoesterase family protein [Scatolibacter rhodanostii]|uniref:metallophosphoesterase family protein n=1 Tax=Scatolibacter rhodanostii TaxID=2014781 RepID=UPI000C075752|nr:metallophosphoesterase [Scatolibacter rhodanostii]
MRILVFSDTHGDSNSLYKALLSQPQADIVIHLGDGEADVESVRYEFPSKMFLQVRGNCDFGSTLPLSEEFVTEGIKIFYTHGHFYDVKWQDDLILAAAEKREANVLLYGHTHVPLSTYQNGLHILNPGSLKGSHGSYGFIDITPQGIVTNIIYRNQSHS